MPIFQEYSAFEEVEINRNNLWNLFFLMQLM